MKTYVCPTCKGSGYFSGGRFGEPKDMGRQLKLKRIKLGLTQTAVARHLGVTRAMLCHMENGRRAWTPEYVRAYESWLDRTLKQLKGMLK